MGLDMYLYAEEYVSGYEFAPQEQQDTYKNMLKFAGLTDIADEGTPMAYVRACILYWRKANAIHAWFVDNVQNGVDECQTSKVTYKQLETLLQRVEAALKAYKAGNKELAEHELAPRSGFFFGSTNVDEWYAEDLERTQSKLKKILEKTNEGDCFYYRASW